MNSENKQIQENECPVYGTANPPACLPACLSAGIIPKGFTEKRSIRNKERKKKERMKEKRRKENRVRAERTFEEISTVWIRVPLYQYSKIPIQRQNQVQRKGRDMKTLFHSLYILVGMYRQNSCQKKSYCCISTRPINHLQ